MMMVLRMITVSELVGKRRMPSVRYWSALLFVIVRIIVKYSLVKEVMMIYNIYIIGRMMDIICNVHDGKPSSENTTSITRCVVCERCVIKD